MKRILITVALIIAICVIVVLDPQQATKPGIVLAFAAGCAVGAMIWFGTLANVPTSDVFNIKKKGVVYEVKHIDTESQVMLMYGSDGTIRCFIEKAMNGMRVGEKYTWKDSGNDRMWAEYN